MPATDDRIIEYTVTLMDRAAAHFCLAIDPIEFILREPAEKPNSQWVLLDAHQCPNCPLTAEHAYCPAALQLAPVLKAFNASTSHDPVTMTVVMPEVNLSMSKRLRLASRTDSSINAVIILDMLAKMLPDALEYALDELHPLFDPLAAYGVNSEGPASGSEK